MESMNYAAIDIGSNAARLLIKNITVTITGEKKFTKLLFLRIPLRLGMDVFSIGEISEKKSEQLMRTIKAFKQLMRLHDVECYRVCATSAMRDAINGKDLIKKIYRKTGIEIEVINGKEEARILYENHVEKMPEKSGNFIFVDVGGGSTEVTLISDNNLVSSTSYNIGTLRMLNNAVEEGVMSALCTEMECLALHYPDVNLIGSGGNINKLYRLSDEKDKKRLRLPVTSLEKTYKALKDMSVEERIEAFSLKADRADVIVPAAEIFLTIVRAVKASYIYVPTIGLADAIIDKMVDNR